MFRLIKNRNRLPSDQEKDDKRVWTAPELCIINCSLTAGSLPTADESTDGPLS